MKKQPWRVKWYFWFFAFVIISIGILIAAAVLSYLQTGIPRITIEQSLLLAAAAFTAIALLIALFGMLALGYGIVRGNDAQDEKLEGLTQLLTRNRNLLSQISHGVRLSEAAKTIVFRDMDRQSLREAVLEKLHQQDYDTTYAIIENIAQRKGYEELARQLRSESDLYRNATEEGRLTQTIQYIDRLCALFEWARARDQITRLLKSHPDSPRVQQLPQILTDKKENRKRELLSSWDDAIKRQATDESLEILRDLDLYLTPNEGLALQESARDVFKTKLHNLGVDFTMAVTGKKWAQAVGIGEQIIRDFPNTRMAQEIREKINVLKSKTQK